VIYNNYVCKVPVARLGEENGQGEPSSVAPSKYPEANRVEVEN